MTERHDAHAFDVVFGDAPPVRSLPRGAAGALVALVGHLLLVAAARAAEPGVGEWAADMAATVHDDLERTAPTQLEVAPPLPMPEPEPEPEVEPPTPEAAPPIAAPEPATPSRARPAARAPAAAGQIVAAEPEGPVEMTDEAFAVGGASHYVGGATHSEGTSTTAVDAEDVTSAAVPAAPPAPSLARAPDLGGRPLSCAWPAQAMAMDVYQQHVDIRVRVDANGRAERVRVLRDPGHGFAAAVTRCAMRHRYAPARDAGGAAVAAWSPRISVRFVR